MLIKMGVYSVRPDTLDEYGFCPTGWGQMKASTFGLEVLTRNEELSAPNHRGGRDRINSG